MHAVTPTRLVMWGMEQNVFGLLSVAGDDTRKIDPADVPRLTDTELRKRQKLLGGRNCLFYGNVVSRSQVPPIEWKLLEHEYGNIPLMKTVESGVLLHNVPLDFAMELGLAETRFPKWLASLRDEELRREQTFIDPQTKLQPAYMVPRHPSNKSLDPELRYRGSSTALPTGTPVILAKPK